MKDISFVDTDTDSIKREIIAEYEALSGATLSRADPIRLFLETLAAVIIKQRVYINYAAKMNLLFYSAGDYLDHIGYLVGCSRIPASAATTTIRATLSAIRPSTVIIPAGTRVSTKDNIVFATNENASILSGSNYVDISATCADEGAAGDGIAIGDICVIMDPIPYVATMVNITESEGGTERESDESYRERIRLIPESFSTAGPTRAYEYYAKTASSLITDVKVVGPSDRPGEVVIYALLEGGEIPGTEIKKQISDILNSDDIRPLTDKVCVEDPITVSYSINVKYYIDREDKNTELIIKRDVEKAVETFSTWTKSKLGRDINPSKLIQMVVAAGAKRVDVISPSFTAVSETSVSIASNISVSYGGLEDG